MSERYPDLWFADGTVILRAKDELFRVYGGILAAQSPVFADMFAVPQPEGGEKIEGCSVVDLHDDVRDLKHFLRALHDASYYTLQSRTNADAIFGVLRLATKYQSMFFRTLAISQLSRIFPATLQGLQDRGTVSDVPSSLCEPYVATLVVLLARELNIPVLLPSALYLVATGHLIRLTRGIYAPDGQKLLLSRDDLSTCVEFRISLCDARRTILDHCLPVAREFSCANRSCDIVAALAQVRGRKYVNSEPVPVLTEFRTIWSEHQLGICATCRSLLQRLCLAATEGVWDTLPMSFSVGQSWSDLTHEDS